jgi:hypothetical protein
VGLKSLKTGLGVGGRKRKRKKKARGAPPADLHPPLNKTKVAKAVGLEGSK